MPASFRISHTVEAAALTPRTSNSPWTRRYPHLEFSPDQTQHEGADRMHSPRPARPLGLDLAACLRLIRSRCRRGPCPDVPAAAADATPAAAASAATPQEGPGRPGEPHLLLAQLAL